MKTYWDYSPVTEAHRLLHAVQGISTGFYRLNNFIVLPFPSKEAPNTVIIPDLPYVSINRFWDRVKKINADTIPINIPKRLEKQTLALIQKISFSPPPTDIRKIWAEYQIPIMNLIYQILPPKKNAVKNLYIWQTNFGTSCSFSWGKNSANIYIWLRKDATITNIVEALLTSLTRFDVFHELEFNWSESEAIVDWLLTYSPIAEYLKKIDPDYTRGITLKNTRANQFGTLIQKSQVFLARIGVTVPDQNQIKNIDTSAFSLREKQLLNLLITRSPQLVTIDEIANLIFGSQSENFSLYAISKSVQRLRDRLEDHGISGSFIQTKRGEGYLLAS